MRFAINVPNFGTYSDPRTAADLAREAEDAGWDGFFVWDHILGAREWQVPIADPWVLLSAVAMRTERIRLGPMVTPIPRRRPWKLARETVTLDHLSRGRLVLGVGLGFPPDAEFEQFGEDGDPRVRAAKLDEGLAVLTGLWSGQPFRLRGAPLPGRGNGLPAPPGPGAPDPDLGRGRASEPGAAAPGRPMGRRLPDPDERAGRDAAACHRRGRAGSSGGRCGGERAASGVAPAASPLRRRRRWRDRRRSGPRRG